MTQPAVVVEHLTKRFGDFTAVDDISFEVPPGEIFGFLGHNGAGKSTTIRMLCGILQPTSGRALVAGFDAATQPEPLKQRIGYMSQRFSLYGDLTVEENLDFYAGVYGVPPERAAERKAWALEMSGLAEERRRLTAELPTGFKQRLALGCAVVHEPPILFLDEPTAGVDPVSRRQFWDLIYGAAGRGVTVFVTTHYMDEAEHCDRIALIYGGRLAAMGSPAQLKATQVTQRLLEVRCADASGALPVLAALPEVSDAALFGAAVHMSVDDPEAGERRIREALARAGIAVETMQPIEPSLEDAFISVIRRVDREIASAQGAAPC